MNNVITEQVREDIAPDIEEHTPIADRNSELKLDEVFISITDKKAHIEYANQVFSRISQYSPEELSGKNHNVIRHPEMPRAVFRIFWEYLKADKMAVAYAKNRTKDGSYYWVLALVISHGNTYQSIRIKPGSELFKKVQTLYAQTLNFEKRKESETDRSTAIDESTEFLLNGLKKMGYNSYDEFLMDAVKTEVNRRIETLRSKNLTLDRYKCRSTPPELIDIAKHLNTLVIKHLSLNEIESALYEHADYILNLAHSILLLSLNAQIGSTKLDKKDISLSVVAEKMGEQSMVGERQLMEMKKNISLLHELSAKIQLNIILTALQTEQTLLSYKEADENPMHSQGFVYSDEEMIEMVLSAYVPRLQSIISDIQKLPEIIKNIVTGVEELEKFLMVLRFIHITGKVEIARMKDNSHSFSNTFSELIQEVENAEKHVKELSRVTIENKNISDVYTDLSDKLKYLNTALFK